MKKTSLFALVCILAGTVSAQSDLPFQLFNLLRVEYDDNVFTTGDGSPAGKQDSFKIVEQIEFLFDSQQNNTYYGIRYSPTFTWFEDRPGDSTDLSHQLDLILNHDFTPRTSASLKHVLRRAEEPELVVDDVTFRNENDYLYNSTNLSFITQVVPEKTSVQLTGRFIDFSYDDSDVAEVNDYQELTAGVDLIQVVLPETTASLQFRYTDVDYETDFRDFETIQAGVALNRTFNPRLRGQIRGGYQMHDSNDEISDDSDTFYLDGSLNYQAGQATRFALSASFAQEKSPVVIFSTQEKASVSATVSHDLTASINLRLRGTYSQGSFDQKNATVAFNPDTHSDGDEDIIRFVSTLAYRINARNSVEATYHHTELDSDVRPGSDYERNRISLGWKYSL